MWVIATICDLPCIDAGTRHSQSKSNYDIMCHLSLLSKTAFTKKSVKEGIVEETVYYIFYRDKITTVSWGTLTVSYQKMRQSFSLKLPGEFHEKSSGKKIVIGTWRLEMNIKKEHHSILF